MRALESKTHDELDGDKDLMVEEPVVEFSNETRDDGLESGVVGAVGEPVMM
jgi:hypothetical protein